MRYRKIDVRIWDDEKIQNLSNNGRLLFIYLLTNKFTNAVPGLYKIGFGSICDELGLNIRNLRKAFDEGLNQNLFEYDENKKLIFIKSVIKYDTNFSVTVIKGWQSHWNEIPTCELKNKAGDYLFEILKNIIVKDNKGIDQNLGEVFTTIVRGIGGGIGGGMVSQETRDKRQETRDKRQETRDKRQETRDKRQDIKPPNPLVELKKTIRPRDERIETIFNFWREKFHHPNAKLDKKRRQVISEALKMGYDVDKLCNAITGCSYTPHNIGENDRGQKYDGLGIIFKNADQIDRFIGNFHNPPRLKNPANNLTSFNISSAENWLMKQEKGETYEQ